jgi:hypothetical protein
MTYTVPTERAVAYGIKADADWNVLVQDLQDHETRIAALEATGGTIISPTNVPIGVITMWSGAEGDIPTGWSLCDGGTVGTVVTPNLQDKFVIGAGNTYNPGDTGGSATHSHSVGSTGSGGSHTHSFSGTTSGPSASTTAASGINAAASSSHTHTYSGSTGSAGSHTHSVGNTASASSLPPYYALCFIMRTS